MQKELESLKTAKENTTYLLEDGKADSSIDMHGLSYWASEVERLRELIKNNL